MKFQFIVIALLFLNACKEKTKTATVDNTSVIEVKYAEASIDLEIYDFEGFKTFLDKSDDKTYVINFWATWCGPCVKELPYFEQLHANYKNKDVEVILVSLDFPHVYETKLKPFILKHELKSRVIVLNDGNENKWINAVDASWSGAIPATIIYNKNERKFFERSFTFEELEAEVKQLK